MNEIALLGQRSELVKLPAGAGSEGKGMLRLVAQVKSSLALG